VALNKAINTTIRLQIKFVMKIQPLCGAAGLPGFKSMMKIEGMGSRFQFLPKFGKEKIKGLVVIYI